MECVGHVQKRVGTQLRDLRKITGNSKLVDGKTLGGKGRLTLKEIDKLQLYYGMAIRRNVGDIDLMKRDIKAILRHRLSTDKNPNHSMCPTGPTSWCKYNRNPTDYVHKNPLSKAVAVHIKPVFDRLSDSKLLKRCVDGFTQNAAESFNNILWHFCPKSTFVGAVPLNIASALAVITYNDGYSSLLELFQMVGLSTGEHTIAVFKKKDMSRIYIAQRNLNEKEKKIRQANRKRRLEMQDSSDVKEGLIYEAGRF